MDYRSYIIGIFMWKIGSPNEKLNGTLKRKLNQELLFFKENNNLGTMHCNFI